MIYWHIVICAMPFQMLGKEKDPRIIEVSIEKGLRGSSTVLAPGGEIPVRFYGLYFGFPSFCVLILLTVGHSRSNSSKGSKFRLHQCPILHMGNVYLLVLALPSEATLFNMPPFSTWGSLRCLKMAILSKKKWSHTYIYSSFFHIFVKKENKNLSKKALNPSNLVFLVYEIEIIILPWRAGEKEGQDKARGRRKSRQRSGESGATYWTLGTNTSPSATCVSGSQWGTHCVLPRFTNGYTQTCPRSHCC